MEPVERSDAGGRREPWGRLAPVVALAFAVVLAGCGGGAGVPDRDPYEVPPRTTTVDPGDDDVAPGVTAGGIRNPYSLVEAHALSLGGRSYRVRRNRTVVDGTTLRRDRVDARVTDGGRRFYLVTERRRGGEFVHEEYWSGDGATLRARGGQNGSGFRVSTVEADGDPPVTVDDLVDGGTTFRGDIYRYLTTVSAATVSPLDGGNGRLYVVRAQSFHRERLLHPRIDGELRSASLRMVVTEAGLVRRLRVTCTIVRDGTTLRLVDRLRFGSVGRTDLSAPAWASGTRSLRSGNATGESRDRGDDDQPLG